MENTSLLFFKAEDVHIDILTFHIFFNRKNAIDVRTGYLEDITNITLAMCKFFSFVVTEIVRHVRVSGTGNCLSATLLHGGKFRFVAYIFTFFSFLFIKHAAVTLNGLGKITTREIGKWFLQSNISFLLHLL